VVVVVVVVVVGGGLEYWSLELISA